MAQYKCVINKENNVVQILCPVKIVNRYSRESLAPRTPKSEVYGRWTKEEHLEFVKALQKYGKNWSALNSAVTGRTLVQIRTHAQKFFIKIGKFVPSGMDIVDFIRSKPVSFFISFTDDNNQQFIEDPVEELKQPNNIEDYKSPLTPPSEKKRKKSIHKRKLEKPEEPPKKENYVEPTPAEDFPPEVPQMAGMDPVIESLKSVWGSVNLLGQQLQIEISSRSIVPDVKTSLLDSWNNLYIVAATLNQHICDLLNTRHSSPS